MASEFIYTAQPANVVPFLEKIRKAGVPPKVTLKTIESFGFKSKNDRRLLPVLKGLGLVDSSGAPTERSGNLLGVGYLLGHRHATTTNQYVHARRRAAESVLLGQNSRQIESSFEVSVIGDRANSAKPLQCEEQDSNLHVLRTLEPKSSASANSAILACGVISNG